jgi:RNA polymerase sigma-70 factor (ECF subfamily)
MSEVAGQRQRDEAARFVAQPNAENFAELFRAVSGQVAAYFRVRGCRPPADEDLTQDVMLTVYRQIGQLRDHGAFRAWLFKIARNALLQFRKRSGREESVELDRVPGPAPDPLANARFLEWMEALNAAEREAIMLRYVEGLEYHEIAELLEIPLGTVQWRIFESKKKLAARYVL